MPVRVVCSDAPGKEPGALRIPEHPTPPQVHRPEFHRLKGGLAPEESKSPVSSVARVRSRQRPGLSRNVSSCDLTLRILSRNLKYRGTNRATVCLKGAHGVGQRLVYLTLERALFGLLGTVQFLWKVWPD